jgi:hypothetical protein
MRLPNDFVAVEVLPAARNAARLQWLDMNRMPPQIDRTDGVGVQMHLLSDALRSIGPITHETSIVMTRALREV